MPDPTSLDRRRFLTTATATATGVALGGLVPGMALGGEKALSVPGKVVRVHAPGAVKGGKVRGRKVLVAERGRELVRRALVAFTGEATPEAALRRFVAPDDVVGLKVNCLGSPGMASHPDITFALAELLQAIGVAPERIFVFDQYGSRMQKAGYRLSEGKGKVQVIRHQGASASKDDPRWGYGESVMTPAGPIRFAKLVEQLTAIIGLPVPKDHDLNGVTGAIKNVAFGCIDTPSKLHCNKGVGWVAGEKVKKAGTCQPACKWGHCSVPRLYSDPRLKDKVRFHLADATAVLYHGGPQFQAQWTDAYDSVLLATDPVAMDATILRIVDEHRVRHGLLPISEIKRPRARPAAFIAHAAQLGLGVADPVRLEEVKLG